VLGLLVTCGILWNPVELDERSEAAEAAEAQTQDPPKFSADVFKLYS